MLDPELVAALAPILADLTATCAVPFELREWAWPDVFDAMREPRTMYAVLWTADGCAATVSVVQGGKIAAQVVGLADQVQDEAVEALWRAGHPVSWPECPSHPASHPLEAQLVSDHAVWRCPRSGEVIADVGALSKR